MVLQREPGLTLSFKGHAERGGLQEVMKLMTARTLLPQDLELTNREGKLRLHAEFAFDQASVEKLMLLKGDLQAKFGGECQVRKEVTNLRVAA